ncbi:homoisocitrate dehydrogenase [Sphaeroforma arctica JP610]|uniref:Homoisocitrate dehydrogenase n=1 Tax=Sphaeroforma arctica JP610 TaxID=667725 RepID=A0A0L0FSV9_9EUKA|nr:homoisocitrate dehydrogenase [Sphaeroforma arctica JP610]KNC79870.1 homoisocitrate dehydrogenase [Sphaeroforma arctica JP610]|eukprot:XP_014153772.1 homoisocitrate dehydrogenase [Sphaeroforma arctica JP610]
MNTLQALRLGKATMVGRQGMHTIVGTKKIGLLPADGIGKEVMPCVVKVLEALKAPFEYVNLDAGFECFERTGTALPDATVEAAKKCDGLLFGAVSSPSHKVEGYSSPIVAIRKKLDLYANVRPVVSSPVPGSLPGIDALIIRENTECLYVKDETIEDTPTGKRAVAKRVITEAASKRIAKLAYQMALKRASLHNRQGKVTIVHKSNVLSVTDGLFRESCLAVAEASELHSIKTEEQLVDSMVYRLFRDPQNFDVIVAPNMYGDIVSDGAAAVVGGLGLVPSANVGDEFIMCEPVHGSAPDIVGQQKANPIAMIRCGAMLLEHMGMGKESVAIEEAIQEAMHAGTLTPDLGGTATTTEVADFIAKRAVEIFAAQPKA